MKIFYSSLFWIYFDFNQALFYKIYLNEANFWLFEFSQTLARLRWRLHFKASPLLQLLENIKKVVLKIIKTLSYHLKESLCLFYILLTTCFLPSRQMKCRCLFKAVKDKIFAIKGYWGRPSGRRILMAILNLWKLRFRNMLKLLLFKS